MIRLKSQIKPLLTDIAFTCKKVPQDLPKAARAVAVRFVGMTKHFAEENVGNEVFVLFGSELHSVPKTKEEKMKLVHKVKIASVVCDGKNILILKERGKKDVCVKEVDGKRLAWRNKNDIVYVFL